MVFSPNLVVSVANLSANLCQYIACNPERLSTDQKVSTVGEELWKEKLPLQKGNSGIYQLEGLKSFTWYEVKISYSDSILACFSVQLLKRKPDNGEHDSDILGVNPNRRLLDTEELIFKTDDLNTSQGHKLCVLVSVEPEGFVAIPNISERNEIVFNIVCDELLLHIPYKAWRVAVLVLLTFMVPRFLPLSPNVFKES